MSIFNWARDTLGIGLDRKLKKKTELEMEKLKSEKLEKLIKPADQEDVEKYDPNTKKLIRKLGDVNNYIMPIVVTVCLIASLIMHKISFLGTLCGYSLIRFYSLILLLILAVLIIRIFTKKKRHRNQLSKEDNNDS